MYGPKTDVWAFGVLLYEMLHGDPPLSFCQVESELKLHIAKPISARAFKMSIPQDLKDLIIKCLEVDERRRISVRDLQFHPYIQRAMRELGRSFQNNTPSQRDTQFSSALSTYKPEVNRSNSTSHL